MVRQQVGVLLSAISEPVVGAAVVRSYAIEDRTQERIDHAIDEYKAASTSAQGFTAFSFSLGGISAGLANAGVLIVGVWLGFAGDITAGKVLAFAFLVTLFVGPVQMGTQILTDAQNAIASWRRVIGILDTPADLVDPGPDGQTLPRGPIDVTFDGVGFAYPGGPPVLRDVDDGHRLRHPDRDRRRDRVRQVDVRQAAHPADGPDRGLGCCSTASTSATSARPRCGAASCWCRRRASSSTTRSPPTCATAGSTRPRTRSSPAPTSSASATGSPDCRAASAPGSGQRGESLSAGERQLVALLRAHLADPDLLVLDEATSAVDPALEMRIGRALERLMSGRTSVTIAHRLSTAENADEVVVVDRGRIVQRGPHASWSARRVVYAGLHASWVAQQG